ncbi:MAG: hypothetical protein MI784_03005 [Cytophagales bacterium]|nr:hypothetical protein [Cytophagales bacterium]
MKVNGKGDEVFKNAFVVEAEGYHGDMDYEVNKKCEFDLNDKNTIKELISFEFKNYCWNDLDTKYKKFFIDNEDWKDYTKSWEEFLEDWSEMHDDVIQLNDYSHIRINGIKYSDYTI